MTKEMTAHFAYSQWARRGQTPRLDCSRDIATATLLELVRGGSLHDAQGGITEAVGTRTVHIRPGPAGQNVCAEFRVPKVKLLIFSMGKLVTQGQPSKQDQTAAKTRHADARLMNVGHRVVRITLRHTVVVCELLNLISWPLGGLNTTYRL